MSDMPLEIKSTAIERNTVLDERYLLLKKVATGGMGHVYRAEDLQNPGFPLAVKILHKGFLNDQSYLERFKREVELCEQVSHPNVLKIFDLVMNREQAYFSMEFIEGSSLESLVSETGPLNPSQVMRFLVEVCDGLRAIHNARIIHRDLKPGNLMMQPDGSIKIIDFGISRDTKASRLTTKNIKVGSLLYIPPEVWMGKPHTIQADFYSLGCSLYEVCTGETPYYAENPAELMEQHRDNPIPHLPEHYPLWMQILLEKLMAKKASERPNSAEEILSFIREYAPESESIQTFHGSMQHSTVRSGQGMISVFDSLSSESLKNDALINPRRMLMFSLQATRPAHSISSAAKEHKPRSKTVMLRLPNKSALVFEFEMPSRDFLFLGVFLGSLNSFDWFLTHKGVSAMGVHAEGNHLLKQLMIAYGLDTALLMTKGAALLLVLLLTVVARRSKAVKNVVGTLSLIYLMAAVIPWIYLIYYR
jgi:serine/threonine protein kinase